MLETVATGGGWQNLTFPPIDVPHHELAAEGFKLGIFG
jgi:hypothetical protein